jgi:hypothetical protein
MTPGRINKKDRQAEQLRRKRAQAVPAWPTAAKTPPKAIPVASASKRAPAGLAKAHYPTKRSSLGKRQVPGGAE